MTSGMASYCQLFIIPVPTAGALHKPVARLQVCLVCYSPLELIHNDSEEDGLKRLNPTAQNAKRITQQLQVHSPHAIKHFYFLYEISEG
jgi:hypothetical protein